MSAVQQQASNQQRQSAFRLILIQSIAALLIILVLSLIGGWQDGLSALLAGIICVIANTYFAKRIFKHYGAQEVKQFIRAYFMGELTKLAIIIVLMLLALILLKVKPMPFLITFVILQLMMSFTPLIKKL